MARKSARRSWGSGSLTWLTTTRVRLRVRVDGDVHSKTVRVTHRDHGGRRRAEAALEAYKAEIEHRPPALPAPRPERTLRSLMADYNASRAWTGKSRGTLKSYENIAKREPDLLADKALGQLTADDFDDLCDGCAS
jgi:hypothetical protein